jgi:hypothetical protein
MSMREDTRMGLRWVLGRPVETLLLVFGISLGIGATAAGIALAGHTAVKARELLASTAYREIVVSTRENATDMDLPAVAQTTTTNVVLTSADLTARADAQDVQYAYIANRMDMRLGAFQMQGFPGGGAPMAAGGSGATVTTTTTAGGTATTTVNGSGSAQASAGSGNAPFGVVGDGGAPPDGFDPGAGMPPGGFPGQQAQVTLDGPQPVLEEINGYEVSPEFFSAWAMNAASGSLFTTADMKAQAAVVVLGSKLATALFEDGISLDRQVLSFNRLYKVTGILAPTGTDYDSMAFTPALMVDLQQGGAAQARMFMRFDTSLHFTVADSTRLEQARAQLESWFTQKYGASSVVITVPRSAAEAARDRNGRLVTVILFLALSALLIAAANVTNILSSRAMRKRRAVGILKALGATQGGVFRLFVIEALIIGGAGAVLGTGFSILISWLMQTTMGFGGVLVGLLAGGIVGAAVLVTALDILPAMQAARVPAAEAIRYE